MLTRGDIEQYSELRIVPELKLEQVLELLSEEVQKVTKSSFLFDQDIQKIALLTGKILRDYTSFNRLHPGINWELLSNLDRIFKVRRTSIYSNLPGLLNYSLDQKYIKEEFSNLGEVINLILKDRFYRQYDVLMPRFTAIGEFIIESESLRIMHKEIEMADFDALHYYWNSDYNSPPGSFYRYSPYNGERPLDPIGRIHCILTLGRIGEAINGLSQFTKKNYFTKSVLERLKKMRDVIFHPEVDENWLEIQAMIGQRSHTGKIDLEYFFNNKDDVIIGYALARKSYDFLAGRKWDLDETPAVENLFDSQEFRRLLVSKFHRYILPYYNRKQNIPTEVLWKVLTQRCKTPAKLPQPDKKEIINKATVRAKTLTNNPNEQDVSELERTLRSLQLDNQESMAFKKEITRFERESLRRTYLVQLNQPINNEADVIKLIQTFEGINRLNSIDKRSLQPTSLELKQHKDICDKISSKNADQLTTRDIKDWAYSMRISLYKKLEKLYKLTEQQKVTLDEFFEEYICARDHSFETYIAHVASFTCQFLPEYSDIAISNARRERARILTDYPFLEGKYLSNFAEQEEVINKIIAVDIISKKAQEYLKVKHAVSIIPRLIECLEKVQHYSNKIKNPSSIDTALNMVWPIFSTIEFFIMVAGSLTRACVGERTKYGSNEPFIKKVKEGNLYEVLKNIQKYRGQIAHVQKETAGNTNKVDFFISQKYEQYASICIGPLKDILNSFKEFLKNQFQVIKLTQQLEVESILLNNNPNASNGPNSLTSSIIIPSQIQKLSTSSAISSSITYTEEAKNSFDNLVEIHISQQAKSKSNEVGR